MRYDLFKLNFYDFIVEITIGLIIQMPPTCKKFGANVAWDPRISIRCKHHDLSVVTYLPRNPFISRRRSLDVVETIRYTWNQLARSAGKWAKGLTVLKRQGERERGKERERRTRRVAAVWEMTTIAWSTHLPFSFSVTRISLFSLFAFPLFACISVSICSFVSTFHLYLSFVCSSAFPCAYSVCLSFLSLLFFSSNGSLREKIKRG